MYGVPARGANSSFPSSGWGNRDTGVQRQRQRGDGLALCRADQTGAGGPAGASGGTCRISARASKGLGCTPQGIFGMDRVGRSMVESVCRDAAVMPNTVSGCPWREPSGLKVEVRGK